MSSPASAAGWPQLVRALFLTAMAVFLVTVAIGILNGLDLVVRGWTMPGISTEQMDLYLASYGAADRSGTGGGLPEEQEDITVHEMPLATLAAMSDRGEVTDIKTLVLILALRLRQPELFAAG